jgi:hypothetical protein
MFTNNYRQRRQLIPTAVFTVLMVCLLVLTFTNDEHLARIFHEHATAWAVIVHVAIIALPPTTALLPAGREQTAARGVWLFALILAAIGNVAGSLAHAAGVSVRAVLDGWPQISAGAAVVAVLGGLLIVVAEGIIGYLWESSLARLFAANKETAQVESLPTPAAPAAEIAVEVIAAPAPLVHEPMFTPAPAPLVHEQTAAPADEQPLAEQPLTDEERAALLTIKHAVNPQMFTTGEANEHSPFARTRTHALLGAAEAAGILNKAGRGQWAFTRPENGQL